MGSVARRLGLALLLLMTACGSGGDGTGTSNAGPGGSTSPSPSAEGPGRSDTPDPALSGSPTPTLPDGDLGTDDSGKDKGEDTVDDADGQEDMRDAAVPQAALLGPATVASIAGGSWTEGGEISDCVDAAAHDALATRGAVMGSTGGNLMQLVGAYKTKADAIASVASGGKALTSCGFTETGDPRLGDASLELTREPQGAAAERAIIVAAEGALVVLVADGSAAALGAWESLTDLALGTSCPAGVHGCH